MLTLRDAATLITPAAPYDPGGLLYDRFRAEPDTLIVPVVDDTGKPVGLLDRNDFFLKMAAEYGRALYARRPISALMHSEPLIVDAGVSLADFTADSLSCRPSELLSGYIVTDGGRYLGVGTILSLLQASSDANRKVAMALASANAAAEQARTFMTEVVESMPAVVFVKQASDNRYILLNRAGEQLLGYSREEMIGRTDAELYEPGLAATYLERDQEVLVSGEVRIIEEEVVPRRDGATITLRTKKRVILGKDGRPQYLIGVSEDISERKRAEAQIARLAHYDPLTDLPNRVLFQSALREALSGSRRRPECVAVHCIDLDRFKVVNDTLGHPAGDALLRAAADRLRGCVREGDTVARLGGDEFAVVQRGLTSDMDATRLAARIVDTLSQPFDIQGHQVVAGASVGVALSPNDGLEPDELLKKSDMALYRAKAEGRGGFHFFEPAMDEKLQAKRALEVDLRKALADGQFELHYQPLYNLAENRISGCEALVRWNHPLSGMISPADFIPLAEEIGLITPIGDWVLREACEVAVRWPSHVRLAVNLSPAQFRGRHLVSSVVSALAHSGLEASRLELEITESVLLQNNSDNLAILHDLKAMGVRISMDDFGTGYSSLSYLRSFPFDKIKIDQTFVRDILHDSDAIAIIRAVMDMGASLGIVTTAEGVESDEQLEELRRQGCQEIQGYLISRPAPAAQIADLLGAGADLRFARNPVIGTMPFTVPGKQTAAARRRRSGVSSRVG
jgi:diguanylate cyclase (GGDEF)-like protein/PAS domain S-box-containing protein